jgi:hypothetical protein
MADQQMRLSALNVLKAGVQPSLKVQAMTGLTPNMVLKTMIPLAPGKVVQPIPRPAPNPAPAPAAPTTTPAPAPVLPAAPPTNPFELLPMPSAGDRIRSEDFRALSTALRLVYDASVLSAGLFGRSFAEAKLLLAAQQYEIARVITVLGTELTAIEDNSLDDRRVVQVMPTALGENGILVVLTEAVDQRRFVPDLTTAPTYRDAVALLRDRVGTGPVSAVPVVAPNLVGLSLADLDRINPQR